MNTFKKNFKYQYETLLLFIDVLIALYCIFTQNMKFQYIAMLIMTFILFYLINSKRVRLKAYVVGFLCVFIVLSCGLYVIHNIIYMDIINASCSHLFLLCTSVYIRNQFHK